MSPAESAPLILKMLPDGINWVVILEEHWTDAKGRVWVCPQGMVTDLASIPEYLWSLIGSPATGQYRYAAAFHDAAYRNPAVTKDDADLMLRELAIACGTPWWQADLIYEGVHVGGESAYLDDEKIARAQAGAMTPAI